MAKGLEESADEYVTPEMDEALADLRLKALTVKFEGPETMRNLAGGAETCGNRLIQGWQHEYCIGESETNISLEEALQLARSHESELMAEAESILHRT
ncbi:hypothetical protein AB0939_20335 [Streptomyces sp. NPDC006990]|uniref:hypothetical protein n=1 Tax=unclassified Streptomyces TaxID=2593676 RepID=UPI003453BDDF